MVCFCKIITSPQVSLNYSRICSLLLCLPPLPGNTGVVNKVNDVASVPRPSLISFIKDTFVAAEATRLVRVEGGQWSGFY